MRDFIEKRKQQVQQNNQGDVQIYDSPHQSKQAQQPPIQNN